MSICRARLTLAALVMLLLFAFSPASSPQPRRLPPPGAGDAILHLATIERIRGGSGYYDAVGDELRRRHYPTTSVFNWRTPIHFLAVSWLSAPVAATLLKALALAALLLTTALLAHESLPIVLIGSLAQLGALATAFKPMTVGVGEVWAGVLIALSLCAYLAKRWEAGAVLAIAAVFMRELAAPYCLVCGLLALSARRRRESYVWIFGGVAYAVYFAIHATQVWAHQRPGDLAQLESWVRWNGISFILDTVRVNGWVSLTPPFGAVLYTVLALAGAASSRAPRQVGAPLLAYLFLFAVAGQPFDYYWGFVTAPIWACAAAYGVNGLRELILSSRRPKLQPAATI